MVGLMSYPEWLFDTLQVGDKVFMHGMYAATVSAKTAGMINIVSGIDIWSFRAEEKEQLERCCVKQDWS
jgi:hypothetical protein